MDKSIAQIELYRIDYKSQIPILEIWYFQIVIIEIICNPVNVSTLDFLDDHVRGYDNQGRI